MPLLGEFLGTMILMLLGIGADANVLLHRSKGEDSGWITITTGWAIAVIIGVFVAQSVGSVQADINPAVTFAKYSMGIYSIPVMFEVMGVQMLGALVGTCLAWLAYHPHWLVTKCPDRKLAVFCTQPAIRHIPSNLFAEAIGTFVLVLGVGAIFGQASGDPVIGLGPYLVGILVWGIGLSLGGPTGYAINPARDLAARFVHAVLPIPGKRDSDWGYAWVPVVGPLMGGLAGGLLWQIIY